MKTKIRQLPVIPISPLPPLYAAWMYEVLSGHIPFETDATCDNCAMLPDGDAEQTDSNQYFNPQTKCCTYLPEVHNFLAGRILADEDTAFAKGRATVEARLKAGVGITPLGIGSTPLYSLLYHNTSDAFGRAGRMRCPHYIEEGGLCGIWKNREAVCSTWFCKHVRGAMGKSFWMKMLNLLSFVERNISLWCVTQLDIGTVALQNLLPLLRSSDNVKPTAKEIDGKHDEKLYRAKWGKWFGREAEFYKECALLANDLKWSDIERICGPELQIHVHLLQDAYQKLVSDELPERLRVGKFQLGGMEQSAFAVSTYSGYDTMRLSQSVIRVLPYFDGRPVTEVLDEIVEKENLRVSPDLLRKLVDFGMLVAAEQ
jgi:Fe-S-cluster containining protein